MSLILVHLSIVGMSGIQLTMWNDGNISPGNCGSCIMDLGSLCHMAILSGSLGGGEAVISKTRRVVDDWCMLSDCMDLATQSKSVHLKKEDGQGGPFRSLESTEVYRNLINSKW